MRYVLLSLFLATPAFGGLPDFCLEAIGKGNEKDVARYAQSILARPFPYREEAARRGEECLLHYTGKEHEYSTALQQFFPAQEREAAEAAAIAAAEERERARKEAEAAEIAAAEERQRASQERERALAEQRKAEERAERERLERYKQIAEVAAREESIRRSLVINRLGEACERLYGESPDETISNKLCFDYFLENGLPE